MAVLRGRGASPDLAGRLWELHRLDGRFDLVVSGVGKANAAGAVARVLHPAIHGGVLSVGIAGALPRSSGPLAIRAVVVATACVYADEGLLTPEGFTDLGAMGFPLGPFQGPLIPVGPQLVEALRPLADAAGPVATVSTCSGTDPLAHQVAARTGALAEAMEGAAVAHAGARLGVPAGELRVISNTTGNRAGQSWDLRGALARLEEVIRTL